MQQGDVRNAAGVSLAWIAIGRRPNLRAQESWVSLPTKTRRDNRRTLRTAESDWTRRTNHTGRIETSFIRSVTRMESCAGPPRSRALDSVERAGKPRYRSTERSSQAQHTYRAHQTGGLTATATCLGVRWTRRTHRARLTDQVWSVPFCFAVLPPSLCITSIPAKPAGPTFLRCPL